MELKKRLNNIVLHFDWSELKLRPAGNDNSAVSPTNADTKLISLVELSSVAKLCCNPLKIESGGVRAACLSAPVHGRQEKNGRGLGIFIREAQNIQFGAGSRGGSRMEFEAELVLVVMTILKP